MKSAIDQVLDSQEILEHSITETIPATMGKRMANFILDRLFIQLAVIFFAVLASASMTVEQIEEMELGL